MAPPLAIPVCRRRGAACWRGGGRVEDGVCEGEEDEEKEEHAQAHREVRASVDVCAERARCWGDDAGMALSRDWVTSARAEICEADGMACTPTSITMADEALFAGGLDCRVGMMQSAVSDVTSESGADNIEWAQPLRECASVRVFHSTLDDIMPDIIEAPAGHDGHDHSGGSLDSGLFFDGFLQNF